MRIRSSTSPEREKLPRLDSLDLLRGIAILGIFLMNTQDMSMPAMAYYNPTAYDAASYISPETYQGLGSLDYAVWAVIHVIADLKFITVFSMLFGAGILLQGERLAKRGAPETTVHYLRMAVLLVFGLAHAHLFWYGDVLANYAIIGMLLFPVRRLPAGLLFTGGLCFVAVATFYHWASLNMNIGIVNWLRDGSTNLTMLRTGNDIEFAAYSGTWWQQVQSRSWVSLDNETFSFLNWTLWRCGGSMLMGMALLRQRFFHGDWSRRAYILIALFAIPTGWAITSLGILHNEAHGWFAGEYPDFAGMQYNYWGSLIATFGYLALGTLAAVRLAKPGAQLLRKAAAPVRAVGRTALSNYILQTLIGTTIFYGHGLGYFGWVSRPTLVLIVFAVWVFQLTVSTLWTRRFRQGPLEWFWHRIVYGLLPTRQAG